MIAKQSEMYNNRAHFHFSILILGIITLALLLSDHRVQGRTIEQETKQNLNPKDELEDAIAKLEGEALTAYIKSRRHKKMDTLRETLANDMIRNILARDKFEAPLCIPGPDKLCNKSVPSDSSASSRIQQNLIAISSMKKPVNLSPGVKLHLRSWYHNLPHEYQ